MPTPLLEEFVYSILGVLSPRPMLGSSWRISGRKWYALNALDLNPTVSEDRLDGKSLYFVTLNRNKQSAAFEMFVDEAPSSPRCHDCQGGCDRVLTTYCP